MNKVTLIGYYGFNNTGDEAILYSILRSLKQRNKDLQVTVLSGNPGKTEKLYGVPCRNRWRIRDVISAIWQSDLVVFGGGSLLQDTTSRRSLDYYLAIARVARLLRKPVYFMGQGIGPVINEQSKQKVARVLNRVQYITVRDRDSKQQLLDMGVTKPPIEVTADIVLGLYRREVETAPGIRVLERYQLGDEDQGRMVGISVRNWRELSGYKTVVAELADSLAAKGYKVVFLPFHFPGDVSCARDVVRQMQGDAVVIREECTTIEMLGMISRMELLIGMRMHSLIMAALMGVPSVGLSYDPKIDAAVNLMGLVDGGRVENLNLEQLRLDSMQILFNRDEECQRLVQRLEPLKTKARRNVDILEELLQEKNQ